MRSQSVWLVDKISVKMLKTSKKGSNLQKSLWSVGAAKISGYAGNLQNFFLIARLMNEVTMWAMKCAKYSKIMKSSWYFQNWFSLSDKNLLDINFRRTKLPAPFMIPPVYQGLIITPLRRLTRKNVHQIWFLLIWAIQGMLFLDFWHTNHQPSNMICLGPWKEPFYLQGLIFMISIF